MSVTQPIIDTINLTRSTNKDKNSLYVLGYLMQELGEFIESVDARVNPHSRFKEEHPNHVFEEAADVIQNVFSHMAMIVPHSDENITHTILEFHMANIDAMSDSSDLPIAVPCMSISQIVSTLMASVGRFAQSSMILSGDITHKSQAADQPWIDAAIIVNNVFVAVKKVYLHQSNETIQSTLMQWIDQKNTKWVNVSTNQS